ncbi:Uncharacterized protein ESCO_002016 [Escovopsis weberi]|uniref:Uncharacterized protein n=1 Tax=Escovopsis weberi TaxID=150374 RepID=A0A0M8N2H5_ESCWE|nr:Uncharacterized protein ESCO_002016 [Escovopsis weberi]
MPLIVPGVMSTTGSKTEEWTNKLVGKTLSETESDATMFCKKDLPEGTRVIEGPGAKVTKDWVPERLNVHVAENGIISHVTHG